MRSRCCVPSQAPPPAPVPSHTMLPGPLPLGQLRPPPPLLPLPRAKAGAVAHAAAIVTTRIVLEMFMTSGEIPLNDGSYIRPPGISWVRSRPGGVIAARAGNLRRNPFSALMGSAFRWFLVTASLLMLPHTGCSESPAVTSIPPAEAAARVQAGAAVLVDVREPAEWAETGVVASAHLLALSDLRGERAQWRTFLENNRDKELILYCRSGNRSGQAARLLATEGFRVANAGGLRDWVAAGQPTRKAEEPRQAAAPAPAD